MLDKSDIPDIKIIYNNEKGFILPISLFFLVILELIGTTALIVTTTDIKIGNNYKNSVQAFYDAEAGSQYAIARIEDSLANNTLDLTGSSINVNYKPPAGFSFNAIKNLTQVGSATSNYSFQATGHSGNSSSTVELLITRDPLFQYGAFGNKKLAIKNHYAIYSYDSSANPYPIPTDSTGKAKIGSNGKIIVSNSTFIDGDIELGNEAEYQEKNRPILSGKDKKVYRINHDPLGVIGGNLANNFMIYSVKNDNSNVGIIGDSILLNNGDRLTLIAGNYYLTSIVLYKDSKLNIDASSGQINIYLNGVLEAKNGSSINFKGNPPNFTIFSNATEKIDFEHNSSFRGTVYAPYSNVIMKNKANIYGMLWAKTLIIRNSGNFYFDNALQNKWLANTVSIVSWKEIIN